MKILDNDIVREMTEQEKSALLNAEVSAKFEIQSLKRKLANTDYQAIKYAEGWLTEEEYAEVKKQRQAWRSRINELEEEEKRNDRFY